MSAAEIRLLASARNWIEGVAVEQLKKAAALPGVELAVGLPDLHPGRGIPIGAAYLASDWIYPALVGSDVGCGVGLWHTSLKASRVRREAWAARLRDLERSWEGDSAAWLAERGVAPSGFEDSLGTIGGGNHFGELQAVGTLKNPEMCERLGVSMEDVYLLVHSGSRGVGELLWQEHVGRAGFAGLPAESADAASYMARHDHAQSWAAANRELIAWRVLARLNAEGRRLLDAPHNGIECTDGGRWLHRKGAASSTAGPLVIPGSRGAFSYLVVPTDPGERSAWSVAHGAGRKWSRTDSRTRLEKRYRAQDLLRTGLGTHVVCEDKDLLFEEAPQAYKNIDIVVDDLTEAGLVEVVAVLRPLVTYKVRR